MAQSNGPTLNTAHIVYSTDTPALLPAGAEASDRMERATPHTHGRDAMAAGPPPLAGAGDRGSFSSSNHHHQPPPPPPPKILLAKPPLPHASSSGADDDGGAGARARQAPQPGSLSLVSDAWEVHTDKILPVRAGPLCCQLSAQSVQKASSPSLVPVNVKNSLC